MRDWYHYLLQKPKAYRQQVAFMGALFCTSIIVLFWVLSLPERLQEAGGVVIAEDSAAAGSPSRMATIAAEIRTQAASLGAAFSRTSQEVATTTSVGTSESTERATTTRPGIVLPQLSTSSTEPSRPVGRPILIATSSATSS